MTSAQQFAHEIFVKLMLIKNEQGDTYIPLSRQQTVEVLKIISESIKHIQEDGRINALFIS